MIVSFIKKKKLNSRSVEKQSQCGKGYKCILKLGESSNLYWVIIHK